MAKKPLPAKDGFNEILLYTTPNGSVKVEIYLQNETIWLTQQKIAVLFGVQKPAVTKHLKNIFESGELKETSVSSILEHTAADQKKYQTTFYNLDAIISVGYRVNSTQATAFRIWATERLKEYIIKGFTMDDERLKNPNNIFGHDYFEEQLARIRNIRSSERRFYQKITDIYTQCSADYQEDTQATKDFFATVQNKLHWAISGQTAAELVAARVDSSKTNMGLTTWKNALKGVLMNMKDWVKKLDSFLQFNEEAILKHQGKVSHEVAVALAENEFEKYRVVHDKKIESDFDKAIKKIEIPNPNEKKGK